MTAAASVIHLVIDMVRKTPCVRVIADVETMPVTIDWPATTLAAAAIVLKSRAGGTAGAMPEDRPDGE